jgi:hypothetical protein
MPICTYLHNCERNVDTSSDEINARLKQVRAETGEDFQVLEFKLIKKPFFGKEKVFYGYELYSPLIFPEYQIINFYNGKSSSSINIRNSAEVVLAYLDGILSGIHHVNVIKPYREKHGR